MGHEFKKKHFFQFNPPVLMKVWISCIVSKNNLILNDWPPVRKTEYNRNEWIKKTKHRLLILEMVELLLNQR